MKRALPFLLWCVAELVAGCTSSSTEGGPSDSSGNPAGSGGKAGATLVGEWDAHLPDKTQSLRAIFSFQADGKCKREFLSNKKSDLKEGTYKRDGDKLVMTVINNGKAIDEGYTIKELTDDKLVLIGDKDTSKKEVPFTKKK
jgi:uncharacterized protein (TIGR03066 family)